MKPRDIEIRTLKSFKEMLETESLHQRVWKYPPPHSAKILLTISETGGQVIGAYHKGELIGFSFVLLARDREGLYLRSQLLIVLKEYRDQGIGLLIRTAQRDYAKGMGIKRIEWTFDPLQAGLGHFYIKKLGAVVKRYNPRLYDRPEDNSHRSVSNDRFYAEWHLDSERVVSRVNRNFSLERETASEIDREKVVNNVALSKEGIPSIIDYNLNMREQDIFIEIPKRLDMILKDTDILSKWRKSTQQIFDTYINRYRYAVVDFVKSSQRRSFYLLNPSSEK